MLRFAPAKINLGLYITGKRTDGYHELESLVVPIPFFDLLEAVGLPEHEESTFSLTGLEINSSREQNLVWKAWKLFTEHTVSIPVRIHLHKQIPFGAGLGGGSSDGTAMLRLLNELNNNPLSREELHGLSAELGSDCPLFLYDSPSIIRGRGEIVEPFSLSLKGYYLLLLFPGLSISTREAYENVVPVKVNSELPVHINEPVASWKDTILNDFEKSLFPSYPLLEDIKNRLYNLGALYASLSGSGSALYGIFEKPPVNRGSVKKYIVWEGWLN